MIGGLALYLWVFVPSALFAIFVGNVAVMGLRTRRVSIRGLTKDSMRSGQSQLINVIRLPHSPPADVVNALEPAPVAPGRQRTRG